MSHENNGAALSQPYALQLEIELVARDRIERAERLVHQQDVRIVRESPGNRGTLPHASGELPRPRGFEAGNPDQLAQLARLDETRLLVDATQLERQGYVVFDGIPGKQVVVLENHPELPGDRRVSLLA